MEAIFHEKQEGSLCAQHCLNALLQGHYFTAVDLADIARQLDEKEREQMAEGGTHTEGYKQFLQQPSNNYDDSGFFSVQVIADALKVWGLELLMYNSQNEVSQRARQDPTQMRSYICNFGEHWLAIRKLGNQWFNLNSLLTGPELISDTFLGMFLAQLQQDGYSIFIVVGDLAECDADQLLRLCPAVQPIKPQLINDKSNQKTGQSGGGGAENDEGMQRALAESRNVTEADDFSLQRALQMSMEGYIEESVNRIDNACVGDIDTQNSSCTNTGPVAGTSQQTDSDPGPGHVLSGAASQSVDQMDKPDMDEVRQKRLQFLNKMENKSDDSPAVIKSAQEGGAESSGAMSEDEMLKQAIAMSMSQDT